MVKMIRKVFQNIAGKMWIGGGLAVVLDLVFFLKAPSKAGFAEIDLGLSPLLANSIGFLLAAITILLSYVLVSKGSSQLSLGSSTIKRTAYYIIAGLMIFYLRGGMMALMVSVWGLSFKIAIIPAAILSDILVLIIGAYIYFPLRQKPDLPILSDESAENQRWKFFTVGLIVYLFVLRLLYLGALELIPEEAYYWNYSQHPAWGYLDHPPMVAWLIAAGTAVFGTTEFGIRVGAVICWLITVVFVYALTKRIYGKDAGLSSILILSVLPFFWGIGSLMMPDAPLAACWAGGLYFLYLILMEKKAKAWYGFGICIGLGLISKYTIGVLPISALLFVILDRESRGWLKKPQPYLSMAIAFLLFLPVIFWNSEHGWASFVFQTSRRLNETSQFSLHLLLGSIIILLTPHGLLAALSALWPVRQKPDLPTKEAKNAGDGENDARRASCQRPAGDRWFLYAVVLVPLSIFVFFSLSHQPKLNWTGPIWLSIIPAYAVTVTRSKMKILSVKSRIYQRKMQNWLRRSWGITVVILALLYGGCLYYLAFGIPGIPYFTNMADIAGWRDLGAKVKAIDSIVTKETGKRPLIVGMDKYNISSELAFYINSDGPSRTAGSRLFGGNGLMYNYWFPDSLQAGKAVIMVGRDSSYLLGAQIGRYYDSLSNLYGLTAELNNQVIERFYCRIGYGYKVIR